ncbi:hypothetical protein TNCV_2125001 [Trichonephila clavipes]|nr:hypothetical protein TNCV_2125001 [Trichonephila clavipes]
MGDDTVWEKGEASTNSEVSCDSGSDQSFSKRDTDDKPISQNRGGSERPFFRGGCVQSAITHVLWNIFG